MDCNLYPSFLMLHYPKTIHIHKHDSKLSHHKTNNTQTTQQHNAPAWDKRFFSEWQLQWLETQKMMVHNHAYVGTEENRPTESTHCQYEFHAMISVWNASRICTLKRNRPNKLEVASIALEGCQRREICHYTNHTTPTFHYQRVLVVVQFLFQSLLFIPFVTSKRAVIEFNGMQLRQIQVVILSNTTEWHQQNACLPSWTNCNWGKSANSIRHRNQTNEWKQRSFIETPFSHLNRLERGKIPQFKGMIIRERILSNLNGLELGTVHYSQAAIQRHVVPHSFLVTREAVIPNLHDLQLTHSD